MDEGRLLVVCKDDNALEVVDIATGDPAGAVLASGYTPHEVVATEDGRLAYLPVYSNAPVGAPGSDGRRIDIIDLVHFRRIGEVRLAFASRPHQASLLSTDRILVSTEVDESVTVLNRRTLRVDARLPTGQAESHMFAVTADDNRVVTANVGPGSVSVIDVPSRTLLGVVDVADEINRVCVEPCGRFAYTADQHLPRIAVIDIELVQQAGWIELPSVGFGAAVTRSGSHLVIALRKACEIAVVELWSGEIVHRIPTPAHPQAIVLHPDGIRAYSACDADHSVVEVDIREGRLLRRIQTGRKPDGIAWCPSPAPSPAGR